MDRLSRLLAPGSELWLDGGHNVAGGQAIAQTLAELEERAPKPVALVLGMMGQKDARGFLEHFRGLVRRIVTVPVPAGPKPRSRPGELAAVAATIGFDAEAAPDVEAAIRRVQDDGGTAAAHPDLRLALSGGPCAGAAGGRAGANELERESAIALALQSDSSHSDFADSDRAVDPVLQLLLLHQRADALGGNLPVLEDHQRGHRLDAVLAA